jgi:hypothetical protein
MTRGAPDCNDNDALTIADAHMQAAQAKWSRLTPSELSGIRDKDALIAVIEQRYSLPHWVAVQDVELWLKAKVRARG